MSDPATILKEFKPTKPFFVGIDSDGCIFDSMEIKHKECFTPMFVKHFRLQAVSRYAREVWEFVNLYSKTRGANRFPALVRALNLLRERPQVVARKVQVTDTKALEEWIGRESKLGNATLASEVKNGNKGLAPVKVWSDAVNAAIEDIVHGVPPFPFVRECLAKINEKADAMCISQTPAEALKREWAEHGIDKFVKTFFGKISEFQKAPRHPKWQDTNLAAVIPGWKRFEGADDWLKNHREQELANRRDQFNQFLQERKIAPGRASAISESERNRLFEEFVRWSGAR